MISIVVPVFNEEKTVAELHHRIVSMMNKQADVYEIIFVNDGSTDNSSSIMQNLSPLKIITLQKNYGQTSSLDVGIHEAKGDLIVLLDADLQNDPNDIPVFLEKISNGYDVVVGWRQNRKDPWSRLLFSRVANFIVRFVSKVDLHDFGSGLKAYRSHFVKGFRLWGDTQIFLPLVAKERGAKICEVKISHHPRKKGTSKIKISSMFKAGFDLIGAIFFIKYFSKPLRFFGGWGMFFLFLAFLAFGLSVFLRLFGILNFTESPLPVVGTLFAVLGVLLFMMGLLAEILLRTYYATINQSPYIVSKIEKM